MAGVPAWLIVLVPNEEVSLHIDIIFSLLVSIHGLSRVIHAVFIIDLRVDVARQQQVVVLKDVLVVSAVIRLGRVGYTVKEHKLFTIWEKVPLCAHT